MSKTAVKLKRKNRQADKSRDDRLAMDIAIIAIIILLAFGVRYVGLGDIGITYDEPIYVSAGMGYTHGLMSQNFSESIWSINMEHPPVSKYIYGAAMRLIAATEGDYVSFMAAKLASVLMGAITCVLVYLIGRDFLDRNVGIVSAVLLCLIPVFLANTQLATLESPLALFFTLTVYLFMVALQRGSRHYFLGSAIAFGLTLGTKYNGILVLPVLALIFILFTLDRVRKKEGSLNAEAVRRNIGAFLPVRAIAAFVLITGALFFMSWPWLWADPVGNLLESYRHWSTAPMEYFLGTLQTAPVYYYPAYFAVTTPLLLFLPLAVGILALARSRDAFKIGLLAWLAVPFLYGFSPFVQDGMRYLIMIYPAFALICGYGLWSVAGWISSRYKSVGRKKALALVSALAAVYLAVSGGSVYPYYLDYYNALVGGPHGVYESRSFEFSWWGEGIKAAMDYVEDTAAPGSTVLMLTNPDDPLNFFSLERGMRYYYPLVVHRGLRDVRLNFSEPMAAMSYGEIKGIIPHYVIMNYPIELYQNITIVDANYRVVHEVQVQGAPLVKVYKDRRSAVG